MVWDHADGTMLYRSFVLASLPLLTIALDPILPRAAIGDASGSVHIVDLERGDYRILRSQDLAAALRGAAEGKPADAAEGGVAIVGLALLHQRLPGAGQPGSEVATGVRQGMAACLQDAVALLALSASAAVVMDTHSFRIEARQALGAQANPALPFAASYALSAPRDRIVTCAVCAAFEPSVSVLAITLPPRTPPSAALAQPSPVPVSITSTAAVDPASPLQAMMVLPVRPKADPAVAMKSRVTARPGVAGSKKVVDQPVTFRSQIKSSGLVSHCFLRPHKQFFRYGAEAPRKMFQPATSSSSVGKKAADSGLSRRPLGKGL
jgi:hypothetical protein